MSMKQIYKNILVACAVAMTAGTAVADDNVQTLFGYQASVPQWGDYTKQSGFITFTSTSFDKVTFLKKSDYSGAHLSAGEYVDGKIYAYSFQWSYYGGYEPVEYVVYDAETFEKTKTVSWEDKQRVIDMTYDYTTNTMYALAEDEPSTDEDTGKTSLYIQDMSTGELTYVGDPGEHKATNGYGKEVDNHLVTIAADENGNLYAMSEYRDFFKVNKYTGLATKVGETGKTAVNNEFQSMCFGTDGKIYWAQKHPDYGYFSTIDPVTGEQTKLGTLGDNAQVTALFIKREIKNKNFPLNVRNLTAENTPGTTNVNLKWTLPILDYAGNSANVTAIRIYRIGSEGAVATLGADATGFTDENAVNGTNRYSVVAYNGDLAGKPALVSVFAGFDQLQAVKNLHAVKAEDSNDVTITWDAPTATVNGGYADYANIRYNVYCVNLATGDFWKLSDQQKETSYVDKTLTTASHYCYVVEAVNNGVVGVAAQSDDITIVATYSVPVKFTFENADDAFFWTAMNNASHSNTKYGWSVTAGYAYQRLDGNFAQLVTGGAKDLGDDWLISPAISLKKGTYYLNYYAAGASFEDNKGSWEVFIGEDNTDTSKFTQSIDRQENVFQNGWGAMPEKSFTVDHDGTYYLGLYGFTTCTYTTMRFDNFSITDAPISGITDAVVGKQGVVVTGNVATISADKGISAWTLYNISGQAVLTGNGEGEQTAEISLSSLNAGVYIVNVATTDGTRFASKILVK